MRRGEGHVRTFYNKQYRLISVQVDGVRRQRFEHRLIMEEILGRPLTDSEVVHHIDGDGLNNDPANLEIMTPTEHQNHHLSGLKWSFDVALEMRASGYTLDQIAEKLGYTTSSIRNAFIKRHQPTKDLRWGNTKWDLTKALKMFKEGSSLSKIAQAVGISQPALRKAFTIRQILPPLKNQRLKNFLPNPLLQSTPDQPGS